MAEKNFLSDNPAQFAAFGLNQEMLPVFLALLFITAIAWLFLSNRLYAELQHNFPKLYDSLGAPKLFMKKSFTANFKVIKFLLRKDYVVTDDLKVIKLCQGLRFLFFIYIVCMSGCLVLLFDRMEIT